MAVTLTIGKRNVLYPGQAMQNAQDNRTPTEFWGRANSYTCPRGPEPGRAYLLMLRSELDELGKNAYHELKWVNGDRTLTIPRLVLVEAKCMDLALAGTQTACYFCTFEDLRNTLQKSSINSQYNVRRPAPAATSGTGLYYTDSLNGGSLWTWQTLLTDIWGNLPSVAGTAPTLPYSPDGDPEGWRFIGVSAWQALHEVLAKIDCTTAFDPIEETFSYVRHGAAQTDSNGQTITQLTTSLAGRLMYEFDPLKNLHLAEIPATVRVFFQRREQFHGVEKDTPDSDNWEMSPVVSKDYTTSITGAASGSVLTLWDDLPAVYDTAGTNTNSTDLQTRADEIGLNLVNRIQTGQALLHRIYSGITTTILPGSEIAEVRWREYGDSKGLVTEVMNKPLADIVDEFTGEHIAPPDLARGTHPLWPRLSQPVKPTSSSPNASNLWAGTVQRWAGGAWSTLETCWIKPVEAGVTSLDTNDRFVGRLSGQETDTGDTRPVYLINCARGTSSYDFNIQGDEGDNPTVTSGDTVDFDASGLSFTTEANSTVSLRGIVVRVDDNDPIHDVSFAVDKSVCQHFEMTGSWTGAPYTVDIRDGTRNAITMDASAGSLPPIDITGAAGVLTIAPRNPFHTIKDDQSTPNTEDLDFQDTLELKAKSGEFVVTKNGTTVTAELDLATLPIGSVIQNTKKPILDGAKYYMDDGTGAAHLDWALMDGASNVTPGSGIDMGCGGTSANDPSWYLRARNNRTADADNTPHGRTNDATPATDLASFAVADHPDHRHEINVTCDGNSTGAETSQFNITTDPAYTLGAIEAGSTSPITLDHEVTISNNETTTSDADLEMLPPTKMLFFYEKIANASGAVGTQHASSHQHGGGDEVATATAAANAIPKAGAGGTLADGWISASSVTQHVPADATYITQTPNATLTNEQAMSALATGIVKNTTGTGVQSIAVAGTDYEQAHILGGNDRVLTSGGAGLGAQAEANLTFDSSNRLRVTGKIGVGQNPGNDVDVKASVNTSSGGVRLLDSTSAHLITTHFDSSKFGVLSCSNPFTIRTTGIVGDITLDSEEDILCDVKASTNYFRVRDKASAATRFQVTGSGAMLQNTTTVPTGTVVGTFQQGVQGGNPTPAANAACWFVKDVSTVATPHAVDEGGTVRDLINDYALKPTGSNNQLITDDGSGGLVSESGLTFDGVALTANGLFRVNDGTKTTPSLARRLAPSSGFYFGATFVVFTNVGVPKFFFENSTTRGGVFSNDMPISWVSNTDATLAIPDIYIRRNGVGELRVSNDGSSGAATLIVNGALRVGTATASSGTTTATITQGVQAGNPTPAANAACWFVKDVSTVATGHLVNENGDIWSFAKQTALTAQLTTITHTAPGTPDYALQDLVDSGVGSAWGFATKDEGNTLLSVVKNLQARVAELESKLQTIGALA